MFIFKKGNAVLEILLERRILFYPEFYFSRRYDLRFKHYSNVSMGKIRTSDDFNLKKLVQTKEYS